MWCVVMMLGSNRTHKFVTSQAFCTIFIKSKTFLLQWFLLLTSVATTETANWPSGNDWESIKETPTSTVSAPWRMCSTGGQQHNCRCICALLSPNTIVIMCKILWNKNIPVAEGVSVCKKKCTRSFSSHSWTRPCGITEKWWMVGLYFL